ncbi:MAG: hypothetical protein J1E34_10245, partial [Oscillospiraceae bacterium]|nr:hypothetical protein [Oscillospiraceae bacterium]
LSITPSPLPAGQISAGVKKDNRLSSNKSAAVILITHRGLTVYRTALCLSFTVYHFINVYQTINLISGFKPPNSLLRL